MKNLALFLEKRIKIKLSILVGDFIKDDSGDWYFLGLKAFREKDPSIPISLGLFVERMQKSRGSITLSARRSCRKEREEYQKTELCKLCMISFPPEQLPHKLTMKMLIQTEKQMQVIRIFLITFLIIA